MYIIYSTSKTYKILLIGETYAGKTALAVRLVEDRFSTEQVVHTVGELIVPHGLCVIFYGAHLNPFRFFRIFP